MILAKNKCEQKMAPDSDMLLWKHLCCLLCEKYGKLKAGYHFISSCLWSPPCCPFALALLDSWLSTLSSSRGYVGTLTQKVPGRDNVGRGCWVCSYSIGLFTLWWWWTAWLRGMVWWPWMTSEEQSGGGYLPLSWRTSYLPPQTPEGDPSLTFLNLQLYLIETQI